MRQLKNENFNEVVKDGVWMVDFYADWCGPCKMLTPILEEINYNNTLKVNVDEHQDISNSFGIMSIPTLVFLKDGKEVEKLIGFQSKDTILEVIKKIS